MEKWLRIYRDAAPVEPVAPVVPIVAEPVAPVVEIVPKTKEEWQNLAKTDPTRWQELTQQNMDRVTRESRETKEQLERERAEKQNLLQEINRYKQPPPPVPEGQTFTIQNPPKTQAEWDTLFIESPKYASDLNQAIEQRKISINSEFQRAFGNAAREVQGEHPDMYILEADATGQVLKDGKGKPVIKKDQNGFPMFNKDSEKGKLWDQIYKDSVAPNGVNPLDGLPNAPTLMMAELERRLVKRGQAAIESGAPVRQNQIAPQGVTPPVQSAKVKFATDGEKEHAQKAVDRGTFKNLEEYCLHRDTGNVGFYEKNSRPDFSRK